MTLSEFFLNCTPSGPCHFTDYVPALSVLVATIGAFIGLCRYLSDTKRERKIRDEDRKWRHLQQAREISKEIKTSPEIQAALTMIDYEISTFLLPGHATPIKNRRIEVNYHLRSTDLWLDQYDQYVRACFDALLEVLGHISSFLEVSRVDPKYFAPSLEYYAKMAMPQEPKLKYNPTRTEAHEAFVGVFKNYCHVYGFGNGWDALRMIAGYPTCRDPCKGSLS